MADESSELEPDEVQAAAEPMMSEQPAAPASQIAPAPVSDAPATPQTVVLESKTRGSSSTGGSSQVTPTPQHLEAIKAAKSARDAQAAAQADLSEPLQDVQAAEAKGEEAKHDQQLEAMNALAAREEDDRARREAARAEHAKATQALSDFKFHDYFEGRTGAHIMATLGSALGAFGATLTHTPNFAAEQLDHAITLDFNKQRAELESQQHRADVTARGVEDVDRAIQHEIAASEVKEAHAREATGAYAKSLLARAGIPLRDAENNVIVQTMRATGAEKNAQALARFDRTSQRHSTSTSSGTVGEHLVPAGKGSDNGSPVDQTKLAAFIQEHPQDQAGAIAYAAKELPSIKNPTSTVVALLKSPQKTETLTFTLPDGDKVTTNSTRVAGDLGKQVKFAQSAVDAIRAYQEDLKKPISLEDRINKFSKRYQERENAEKGLTIALGPAQGLAPSDAKLKLDQAYQGHSGLGLEPSPNPEVFNRIADHVIASMNTSLRTMAHPLDVTTTTGRTTPTAPVQFAPGKPVSIDNIGDAFPRVPATSGGGGGGGTAKLSPLDLARQALADPQADADDIRAAAAVIQRNAPKRAAPAQEGAR